MRVLSPPSPVAELPGRQVGDVCLSPADDPQTRREKLARIVLDSMYQFVGLLDRDGTTLEINRAALQGAGIDLDRIRGRPFWEARWFQVSRETSDLQRDFVRRARAGEFVRCDMEIYGEAAGDETIVVDFSLLPVRDASGEVAFLLAEGRNITAKKRAEAEIARKNAELQSLLDKVRQLDQLRSDLFANVSHELRTPLALILGPADELLASGDRLSGPQRRQIEVMRRNASVLLKHVNDLLDLSRLDAHKTDLRYARIDVAGVVRVVAEQFQVIAPHRQLTCVVATPAALEAEMDPDKLERIVVNLLSNAFKFTPAGGRVRCALSRLDDGRCLLTVQDSGPGIPAAQRQAIFERFRQLQQGTTRSHGGTGLGLAIVKEFVDLHRGSIGVTDAPGGGSLFQVELPTHAPPGTLVVAGIGPDLAPRRSEGPEQILGGALDELCAAGPEAARREDRADGPDVLVVEDHPDMRRFIGDALSSEFQVRLVGDGLQGLEAVLARPPDLLVTDLMMPGLGGDRLVEEVRAVPGLADLPVLVLSAKDDDALRARLLAEAAQDYVTKPFSAHELRARVRNLVVMKRARDALRRELVSQSDDLTQLTCQLIGKGRALQESERRWSAIFEHSPVGIALIDAHGAIRTANPAFLAMIGYTAEALKTCTLPRITPVEDRAATRARIDKLLAGEWREYHVQRRYQRLDGELIWANTSVALIPDEDAQEQRLVVVAEDITDRKRAEQALARTRNELAQVARASTLGELAASIAHEVNQPLAAIAANGHACLRWLDGSPPDEREARAAVGRIVRDANRAGEVITRIRSFLRRGEVQRSPVDISQVVTDVVELVRAEAQARHIEVRCRCEEALPAVLADRVQIEQVVLNLIVNGLEAIGSDGGGRRLLELELGRLDEDQIRLDVRDTGPGVDPCMSERLFDAFQTTKPNGLGMGLAISRSIVEAHGGSLWVSSTGRPGATFSLTLPMEAGEDAL